ncbi:MAG: hypothetical protein U1D30_00410 [Planctomycetota bacterium]
MFDYSTCWLAYVRILCWLFENQETRIWPDSRIRLNEHRKRDGFLRPIEEQGAAINTDKHSTAPPFLARTGITPASSARWSVRYCASLACMAGWLSFALLVLALLIPPREHSHLIDEFGASFHGMQTDFPLHVLLGVITVTYYLALFPTLLLPLEDDDRFSWFVHTAYGWILCLFGSLAFLWYRGLLAGSKVIVPWSEWTGAAILVLLFLVPMIALFFSQFSAERRFRFLVGLAAGWALCEVLYLGLNRLPGGNWFFIHAGMFQILLTLLAALTGIFILVFAPSQTKDRRRQVLVVALLAWLFVLAAILCFQLTHQRLWIEGGDGWEVFLCLVVSVLIAPFVSFLGMPGNRESRWGWFSCLALATCTMLYLLTSSRITQSKGGVLRHVWQHYDGPHLRLFRTFDFENDDD